MRVALVHSTFGRSGGAERYALNLAAGLAARGHEVHAFARTAGGLDPAVTFHRVCALPAGKTLKTWSFARSVARKLRNEHFDIVQGFGKTTCQTVHRASGGIHRSYLEKVDRLRPAWFDRVALNLEDGLFASAHLRAIICPSNWVAREVARIYPATAGITHVMVNGVDVTEFGAEGREQDARALRAQMAVPDGSAVLLFVAMNFWLKGLDVAVSVLPVLAAAHLVVVGAGRASPFRVLARKLGVETRLHFAGRQASLAPWYRGADVLLHPTRYDPFANVCLEAAACGTPVVTTDSDGAADLFRDGAAGIVVRSPATADAVADAACVLLARGASARAAARSLAERHTQEAHVSAVEGLYRELAAPGIG
jgi:UDP-glucose:(heptosyl)LPS alpha-1,3-glucosyltransferase